MSLRHAILRQLQTRSATPGALFDALRSKNASFHADVALRKDITRCLTTLKLEHRVWPKGARYSITSKGLQSYG